MSIRILKILGNNNRITALYYDNADVKEKHYKIGTTSDFIKADLLGDELPIDPIKKVKKKEPVNATPPPEKPKENTEKVDKKSDRIRMIKELNSAGIKGMNTCSYDQILPKYNEAKASGVIK